MEKPLPDNCPYCQTPIPDVTGRLGGMCMNCFADIPGIEATTEPGTPLRQTGANQLRHRGASVASALVLTVFAGLFAGGTYYDLTQAPVISEASAEALDEPALQMQYEEAGLSTAELAQLSRPDEPPEPVIEEVPDVAAAAVVPSPRRKKARPESKAKAEPQGLFTMDLGGIGAPVRREGPAPLASDAAIGSMVGKLLRRYERADVRRCYENRLKGGAEIEGSWLVRFTVKPDGSTTRVSVRGKGVRDGELEGCLSRAVMDWRFQPIASEFDVQKAFALKPWS